MIRRHAVTVQLMLLAVVPLVVLFVALSLFYAHNRNTLLDIQFEARVHDLSRGLAARATQSLLAGDLEALDTLAREMLAESNIHGLRLGDTMGDPLVRRGHGPIPVADDALREVFIPLCIPVGDQGDYQKIGEAWVWFDQREVNATKRHGWQLALLLAILLALVVSGIAWRQANRILSPLQDVLLAMEHIRRGGSGIRVKEDADNELGQLQHGVNLLVDAIEEQERLREQALRLDMARERAEQAKAVRTLFLAHMSHEIRTPLNALVGFMQLFRRELAGQPMSLRGQQYLEAMGQSAYHLGELVSDILDFSRIEAGKMSLRSTSFTLVRLVDEVVVELAEQARAKGLFVDVVNFLDLPERVRSDPLRLRQVLINLLSNAIKFTPRGGVILRAMLESPPDEQGRGCVLRFEVEDSGPGIPEDARSCLLEPFEQLDTSTQRAHQGSGLGLSICRGLVERAGGELHIDSAPLGGALLSLSWPVECAELEPERARLPVRASLFDDRPSFRQSAYAKLSRLGWMVHVQEGSLTPEGVRDMMGRLSSGPDVLSLRDPVERGEAGRAALLDAVRAGLSKARHVLVCSARDDPEWERRIESLGAIVMRCPATQRDLERAVGDLGGLPFITSRKGVGSNLIGPSFDGRSILVVDDHPLNREVLARMLEQAGARVIQAEDGPTALDATARQSVDAVLLDLHMPGMDGEAVLKRMRAQWPELPVFILTADVVDETARRLLGEGASAVLHKPIHEPALFAELAAAFGMAPPAVAETTPSSAELQQRFWRQEWPLFEQRLVRAQAAADATEMGEALHALLGTAGVVGLVELAATVRALEACCRSEGIPHHDHPLWLGLWSKARAGHMRGGDTS